MKRMFIVSGALLVFAALPLGPASAQYPPTATASIFLSDQTVFPGQRIVVSGEGWQARSQVTITFRSRPRVLATASVNRDGEFSTDVTIPGDASPGAHTVAASGVEADGSPVTVTATLEVVSAGGAGGLAATGGSPVRQVVLATLLIVLGAAVVILSRRRPVAR